MSASNFFRKGLQILQVITRANNFDRVAEKLKLTVFTKGQCTCQMILGNEHENGFGTMHGGLTATLVDIVTTLSIMSTGSGLPGVSVDLNVSYMKAAKTGEEIVIDAKCIKSGKSLAFSTAEVRLLDGTLIAHGNHTKFLLSSAPKYMSSDSKDI